jgi:hypothetical protein
MLKEKSEIAKELADRESGPTAESKLDRFGSEH